ncbi:MAG TPA: response regulator [Bacteroidota bacterium]|nr:response regulator [Bacteroidota bacterium]
MKVLLVDDEPAIRMTVGAQLRSLGHDVVTAEDGLKAWYQYEVSLPSVVITDLVMPGESGVDLCRRIRGSQRTRYTFIIVLTSMGGKSQYRGAMEAGADDFLPKPCTEEDISVRLRVAERVLRLQSHVHTLEGFLPICSYCRQIRDGENAWHALEEYVAGRASVVVQDALCPACAAAV